MLANGELEYLVFLSNPTGNFFMRDNEVWKGDWGPKSEKWDLNPKLRALLSYEITEKEIQKFRRKQIKMIKKFAKAKKKKSGNDDGGESPDEIGKEQDTMLQEDVDDDESAYNDYMGDN